MKLVILGGGGVRMPAFVRAVLSTRADTFDDICLLEPDQLRRETTARLAVELAAALGQPEVVSVTADPAEALTGADFVFSALRVGGDQGRVIDEQVALRRGVVGQETTGPGGFAMALRTIPVVLSYCDLLRKHAPDATLINFTNPAGLITQALASHGGIRAVGVCDTPGGTIEHLGHFLGAGRDQVQADYAGLNHLGWITSLRVDGAERIGDVLARFTELQQFDNRFAAFDPTMIRRVGALPTEYVYYFYDPLRYVRGVAAAGSSRGEDVLELNSELLEGLAKAFAEGGVQEAWTTYSRLLGVRRDTYMRTDMLGASGQDEARARRLAEPEQELAAAAIGGYEGLALRVIDGLTGTAPTDCIVNVPSAGTVRGMAADDVVETRAAVSPAGIIPQPSPELPRSAQGLVLQVKEYERAVVDAVVSADAELAAAALALHPLVPGITAARELVGEYRERHGPSLAYLS
jgi:6-phospho-beta-glucosidase